MLKYRSDIDVLRAFAVLLVIIYHSAYSHFLPGGYIGVDIFFVISGYLIIPRLVDDLSFKDFYSRRFFRLFPALVTLFFFVGVGSFFFAHPAVYRELPSIIYSSLGLAINEYFRIHSVDYFLEGTIKENPLLHLWSIAVEEQFYLFIPVLLFFLIKKLKAGKKSLNLALGILTLSSLIFSVLATSMDKTAAFYSLPFRLWEILAGGMLASLTIPARIKKFSSSIYLVSLAGLILIARFYTHETPFPGYMAIPIIILTSFALITGSHADSLVFLLKNRILVFLGKISYSLYLWHWPVFIFAASAPFKILTKNQISGWMIILISFGFALLSYYLVEKKFRYAYRSSNKRTYIFIAIGTAMAVAVIISNISQEIIYPKYETAFPSAKNVPYQMYELKESSPLENFIIGSKDVSPQIAFLGDSLTGMLGPGLETFLSKANLSAYHFSLRSCPMLIGFESKIESCKQLQDRIWKFINKNESIRTVVLMSQWSNLFSDRHSWNAKLSPHDREAYFQSLLQQTRNGLNKNIIFILPPMNTSHDLLADYFSYYFDKKIESVALTEELYRKYLPPQFISLVRKTSGITIYDPNPDLCPNNLCPHIVDGIPLFQDVYHFNQIGSQYFAENFLPVLLKVHKN